jgi:hypothetical protein
VGTLDEWEAPWAAGDDCAGAVFPWDAEEVASVAWEKAAVPESTNAIVPASIQPFWIVKVVSWLLWFGKNNN